MLANLLASEHNVHGVADPITGRFEKYIDVSNVAIAAFPFPACNSVPYKTMQLSDPIENNGWCGEPQQDAHHHP